MLDAERREFLKKLAKSAVYAAPVIQTVASPITLFSQGMASFGMMMGGGGGMGGMAAPAPAAPAPWDQPPPSSMKP